MANKEAFFSRKMTVLYSSFASLLASRVRVQENANRPEGVPPSQGGKFVGFGSSPAPPPQSRANGSDVGSMFYKGWDNLTQLAGSAAQQASAAVKTGTETLSQAIKEREVQSNARALADKGKELGRHGWSGLRSIYASVASKVETAARDSGYTLDLGASRVNQNSGVSTRANGVGLNSAAYERLSHSEADGLDDLLKKQRRVSHDNGSFEGFGDAEPDSPEASKTHAALNGAPSHGERKLVDSKNSRGSKSGPIAASKQNGWQDWGNDSEEEEEDLDDDDWGKW